MFSCAIFLMKILKSSFFNQSFSFFVNVNTITQRKIKNLEFLVVGYILGQKSVKNSVLNISRLINTEGFIFLEVHCIYPVKILK